MLTKENLVELFYLLILGREPSKNEVLSHIKDDEDIINNPLELDKRIKIFVESPEYIRNLEKRATQIIGLNPHHNIVYANLFKRFGGESTPLPYLFYLFAVGSESIKDNVKALKYYRLCNRYVLSKKIKKITRAKINFLDEAIELFVGRSKREEFELCLRQLSAIESVDLFNVEENLIKNIDSVIITNYRKSLLSSKDVLSDSLGDFICENINYLGVNEIYELLKISLYLKGLSLVSSEKIANSLVSTESKKYLTIEYTANEIICIGGFFSSGSSAVYDFFRSNDKALTLAEYDVEVPTVSAFASLNRNFSKKDFAVFLLRHLFNVYIPINNHHSLNLKLNPWSFFARVVESANEERINRYVNSVINLVNNIFAVNDDGERKKAFSEFVFSNSTSPIENGKVLILNQSPTAMYIEGIKALSTSTKFIATYRDPRDQYIDQLNRGSLQYNVYKDVEGFIQKYKNDRLNYNDKKNTICAEYTFVETYFEDFITKPEERKRVCDAVGVPYEENRKYFVPEQSQKNMFKYKSWADQDAIRKIESELAEYLWQG